MGKPEFISFFGVDTSNYTTSLAIVNCDENGRVTDYISERKILEVARGERGLRQSTAHFLHTKNIPDLSKALFERYEEKFSRRPAFAAVGYSDRPRGVEGSYMPCFVAGTAAAKLTADSLGVPAYPFPHQCMHIAAALYSVSKTYLFDRPHLAFHVSGGTTEVLRVTPSEKTVFDCEIIGRTLDISAGQLIDRVGVALGLDFPAGVMLEKIASETECKVKTSVIGCDMNFSGAESICTKMIFEKNSPDVVARFAIDFVKETLFKAAKNAMSVYPDEEVVFAGGVSSNSIIKEYISRKTGAVFADRALSSDNAVGTAILASRQYFKGYL